jgi:mono/diheme cytochrome c family protein
MLVAPRGIMTRAPFVLLVVVAGAFALLGAAAAPESNEAARIERGRYLTHDVAMCIQCHTPRDHEGALVLEHAFEGAPVPLPPPPWGGAWAVEAPALAGLPGREEEFLIGVLTTGRRPTGRVPMPPMPSFRMTVEDAQSVAAYLRSLK